MPELIGAFTTLAESYPGYINASRDDDGSIVITVRGDPTVRPDSAYICGHAADRGRPGRCTPGDERCNNYCNLAPQKGRMADHPKACARTLEGETVTVRLAGSEWTALLSEFNKGA